MFEQGKTASLNRYEKRIVKYLFIQSWKNQDIQALINLGRPKTVNSGRFSSVKSDATQQSASKSEFERFERFKRSYDPKTGLNPYSDERLVKSREAMKLAVGVFNNPSMHFRAETFSMLANVAWTYLILEYSDRSGLPLTRANSDKAISLSDFLNGGECPFEEGIVNNLRALITIRDKSEHTILGPYDSSWSGIFQANCMNYDRVLVEHFGERLALADEMSFSLQFSGLSIGQVTDMGNSPLPERITAINSEIFEGLTDSQKNDLAFQFSVVYTTVAGSKSKAAFKFLSPNTAEGKEIANVLVKHKPSSETHPYRPGEVVSKVREKSGLAFNLHRHTEMWRKHQIRPASDADDLSDTKLDYCYFNPTFACHTYNDAWVDLICKELLEE